MKLLIVEDDLRLLRTIERDLKEEGFQIEVAWDGLEGLEIAQHHPFDLILLDGMLPGIDGWTFVDRLRETKSTPVLMLTARDAVQDRIAGLNAGADDYLTKPFHFDELVARIKALIRRDSGANRSTLTHGGLTVDTNGQTVQLNNQPLELTAREYLILRKLLSRRGQVLSNDQLSSYLNSTGEEVTPNTLEVHISRLRKKVGKSTIRTIRGLGYTINTE
ncbi:MAG: response regulator transcription factor [Opitutaceae bacterium]